MLDINHALAYAVCMDKNIYESCIAVLKDELVPAMGCTEPVAVAYAAALARETLGAVPEKIKVAVSGNILKNVKSVIVPNTDGMRGIPAAVAAGAVAGDASLKLEVVSKINDADRKNIAKYLSENRIAVEQSDTGCVFDIAIAAVNGSDSAFVRISGSHTNVVHIEKNGKVLFDRETTDDGNSLSKFKGELTVKDIVEFADSVGLEEVEDILDRQIKYNCAISKEGMERDYGARVGKILVDAFGNDVHNLAKASAAAGSDARMNGCELPVVIVSGSGNQGMAASIPVVVYAEHMDASREKLLRALIVSNLVTIHLKAGIGCLSAYCGNALAIESGVICDGAKSSCAAKVASAVEAGLVGMEMYERGSQFYGGDGILEKGVENTIRNVGDLARNGMRETDEEIIRMMIKNLK